MLQGGSKGSPHFRLFDCPAHNFDTDKKNFWHIVNDTEDQRCNRVWKDEHRVFVVELFLKNTSFKEIYAKFWHKSECEKTPTLIYFEIIEVKILVVGETYT